MGIPVGTMFVRCGGPTLLHQCFVGKDVLRVANRRWKRIILSLSLVNLFVDLGKRLEAPWL